MTVSVERRLLVRTTVLVAIVIALGGATIEVVARTLFERGAAIEVAKEWTTISNAVSVDAAKAEVDWPPGASASLNHAVLGPDGGFLEVRGPRAALAALAARAAGPDPSPFETEVDGVRCLVASGKIERTVEPDDEPARPGPRPFKAGERVALAIVVARPLADVAASVARVRTAVAAGGALLLATVTLAAFAFLRGALAPIRDMRERALRIQADASSLHERLPGADAPDEFGRLAAALNALLERLAGALEHERRFAGDVSHELRTPLANLIARAEVVRDEVDGRAREDLDDIVQQGRRLHALVEKLLFLARADAGEAPFARRRVAAGALARSLGDAIRARSPEDRVAIEVVGAGEATPVEADEALLAVAVGNLVENALVHGAGAVPRLRLLAGTAGLSVSVRDSGPGIPSKDVAHVFDRFYRADEARAKNRGGTGLGLAIVRWIVEAHGGRVRVESEPGTRTEFFLEVPGAAPGPTHP